MTQPTPTVHDVADALIILAGIVAAEKWDGHWFQATPYQVDNIRAAMTATTVNEAKRRYTGWILNWHVCVIEVPDPTADQLAAALLTPDAEMPS